MTVLRIFVAAFLAFLAGPVAAHETTRSYLVLEHDGAAVSAQVRLAFRDLEVVVWMDQDLDGRITWGEARARLDAATAYVSARLSLEAGGACTLRPNGAGTSREAGIDYLDLAFAATCPAAATPIRVATTLFSDIDPSHRMFVTVSEGGRSGGAVIGAEDGSTEIATDIGAAGAFASYFVAGFDHLLAGADHIVFLLVLILPAVGGSGRPGARLLGVIAAVTGFTIAHALTLTAATTAILRPPSALIDVLIALSILVTALDNVRRFIPGPRAVLAAFFGTIHGFGFATALSGLSLGGGSFAVAVLGFNLGIEIAQVGLVLFIMPALAILGGGVWIVRVGSAVAGIVAIAWLWQRMPAFVAML